jgi:hypothetical protein
MAFPIQIIDTFAGQNWLITPAALALNDVPPHDIHAQKWLLTLSGVAMVNLKGDSEAEWLHRTLILQPTVLDPMHYAIAIHSIPRPPGTEGNQYSLAFEVEQGAPYASISAIFNQGVSNNSGFAVDVWRPNHYGTGTDAFSHQPVGNLFSGLQVDVAVRDTDAWLYRVGYSIALLGKIVFVTIPETLFRSNFDPTAIGLPPAATQDVGTANVFGPPRSVIVIAPPALPFHKWVRISRPNGPDVAGFQGKFSQFRGDGVYSFSATLFMPSGSGIASISFETFTNPVSSLESFLHLDLMPNNKVRIDDNDTEEFGSFPRDQPFILQVTLNINASASTVHIVLSGAGASGDRNYTVLSPFQHLSRQFGAIRVWQGFPNVGAFDATNIVVTRA